MRHKGCKSYFVLAEQFTTQSEPAYCGITSLVMVLNALAVDPRRLWKGNWRWYHEELLNCCVDLEEIKVSGITLNIFACLAKCQGLNVEKLFAQDSTVDDFRRSVELACIENDREDDNNDYANPLLVVSYNRAILKQTGTGHFSPIAAYDPPSDQVLILDTARFKYGAHWVPLTLIFEAMLPVDQDTGKSRGYALLSYVNDDVASVMPISILLRSSQAQNPLRQEYKQFLVDHGHDVSWDQVLDYWTRGGKDRMYIWEMLEAQFSPTEKDAADAVIEVQTLLKTIVPQPHTPSHSTCLPTDRHSHPCRPNCNRVLALSPEEAIFIVYLASLSKDRREEIVYSTEAVANEVATDQSRQQLLVEANLVRYAIDNSDEMEEETELMGLQKGSSEGDVHEVR
jgi:glutathione gamma-glutamylcysteinyltransferase